MRPDYYGNPWCFCVLWIWVGKLGHFATCGMVVAWCSCYEWDWWVFACIGFVWRYDDWFLLNRFLVSAMVQIFFAWRIYVLSKMPVLGIFVAMVSLFIMALFLETKELWTEACSNARICCCCARRSSLTDWGPLTITRSCFQKRCSKYTLVFGRYLRSYLTTYRSGLVEVHCVMWLLHLAWHSS